MKKKRKTFKQKWNEIDEVCPCCNQVTNVNRGLTKQNIKKMFKKPTMQDWIIFIILFLSLFGTWVYVDQLNTYKELWENPDKFCEEYDYRIKEIWYNINISSIWQKGVFSFSISIEEY